MVVGGSNIHERLAHFFIDIYNKGKNKGKYRVFIGLNRQTGIYLSAAISTALHGEPSAPDRFNGAAFKK